MKALDFILIANEFSKQFIIVLVSQSIFLFMERDSHTALVNKMGQDLLLGPESESLSTAWLTSIQLYSLPFQSRTGMFILLSGKRIPLFPDCDGALPGGVLAAQVETTLEMVR